MPHPERNEMWNDGHPDEGLLHEWLDEQLSAADAAVLQSHVQTCAECQARVAEARGLMAASHRILSALDDVPANVLPGNIAPSSETVGDAHAPPVNAPVSVAGVTSIDRARAGVAKKSRFRWQTIGAVAAVLLAAVTVERAGLLRPGSMAPVAANEKAADASTTDLVAPLAGIPAGASAAAPAVAPSGASAGAAAGATASANTALPAPSGSDASARDALSENAATTTATAPMARKLAIAQPEASKVAAGNARVARIDSQSVAPQSVVENARVSLAQAPVPAAEARVDASRALRLRSGGVVRDSTAVLTKSNDSISALQGKVAGVMAAATPLATPPATSLAARPRSGDTSAVAVPASPTSGAGKQARATSAFAAPAAPPPKPLTSLPFDSVTVIRSVCAPDCRPVSTVQVERDGALLKTSLTSGGDLIAVLRGRLSVANYATLADVMTRALVNPASMSGQVACNVAATRESAGVQVVISFGIRAPERAASTCSLSSAEIRTLASRIETLSGVDLRQRD